MSYHCQPIFCFNPRAPCGAQPLNAQRRALYMTFQSTRPMRGATQSRTAKSSARWVSIHAPRVGRDFRLILEFIIQRGFNPRAPCGARHFLLQLRFQLFVSIHAPLQPVDTVINSFNPRAPCGARLFVATRDPFCTVFQSTRPVWGATCVGENRGGRVGVSIHTPRVGRDHGDHFSTTDPIRFNPHAPCGARPKM